MTVNLGPHHTGSVRAVGTEQGPHTRVGLGSGLWDPPLLYSLLPKKHWPQLQQADMPACALCVGRWSHASQEFARLRS